MIEQSLLNAMLQTGLLAITIPVVLIVAVSYTHLTLPTIA